MRRPFVLLAIAALSGPLALAGCRDRKLSPVETTSGPFAEPLAPGGQPGARAPSSQASQASQAAPGPAIPLYSRFEVTFDLPGRTREPDDVAIAATFTSPTGQLVETSGFASHGRFKVRYTPRAPGRHTFTVRADAGSGMREILRGSLDATDTGLPGFVGIDPAHHHRLVTPDGSTVFILGENRINVYDASWNEGHLDVPSYVARMAKNGMTAIRVFVFSDCESETTDGGYQIGCLEPKLGRFDERTADVFDQLFEAAEKNGVDVVLVPWAIGFTPGKETWRSWNDNPYSEARGGPAKEPIDFFRSPAARARELRRLRYISARWGASPRLLAIDLLNEPEWDGEIPETTWVPWAEEMSKAWRAADPYHHLVTAGSVGLQINFGGDERPWYASPANDLVQWHLYGKEYYDPLKLGPEMARKVRETWDFDKPIFCGEFAYGGEDKKTYDHTHVGIWSLLMSGAGALAHSAPQYQIDSDEPMTDARAQHFKVLSDFLRSFAPQRALVPRDDARASRGASVLSLSTDDRMSRAIWVLGGAAGYGRPASGVTVTIPTPPIGSYRVTWIDDVSGRTLEDTHVEAGGDAAPFTLKVPVFTRHVAARIVREGT